MDTDIIVFRHRISWTAVLSDLHTHGVTGYRVGALLGCGWSTVQRWRSGSEPGHSYGAALLELHERFCGKPMTQKRFIESELIA